MKQALTFRSLPHEIRADKNTLALVVVDMQRDFLEPGGFGESLGNNVERLRGVIPNISSLIEAFRHASIPVVHTKEAHRADLSDCPPVKLRPARNGLSIGDRGPMGRLLINGEPGNDFIPELYPAAEEIVISKPGKGAFYATRLKKLLQEKEISTLVFTGVTTEVCVQTSMREAADRGFQAIIVTDATESYFPQFHSSAIEMITAQEGIVGCSIDTKKTLEALRGLDL